MELCVSPGWIESRKYRDRADTRQVLFYEDPAHIKTFQEKFATFADKFEPWADHSNAMHQFFRTSPP